MAKYLAEELLVDPDAMAAHFLCDVVQRTGYFSHLFVCALFEEVFFEEPSSEPGVLAPHTRRAEVLVITVPNLGHVRFLHRFGVETD
jgi:hypothetical protein